MPVRSTNLSGVGVVLSTTEKAIVGVEAGRTAIVKSITLYTAASVTRIVELFVHDNPYEPGSGVILTTLTVAGPGGIIHEPWFVLMPGQTLSARTTTGASPTQAALITVHGAYLLGAPE